MNLAFLLLTLLFVPGLLPHLASAVEPSTDHDVVIVGAGAAGLYAAYELDNLGFDVLVLEATNRHGGRVYPSTLGTVGIERGAEEVYGPTNNFVYGDIVDLLGGDALTPIFRAGSTQDDLISMDGGSTCWVSTGSCGSDPDIVDWWNFWDPSHASDPTDELMSDHLETGHGIGSSHRAWHLYEASPGALYGTSVTRLGLRSYTREGNLWPFSGGVYGLQFTGYLDALNSLYFNQVVSRIAYNSPVTVVDTSGIKPVAIDANGVYHYADAILVTVSVGVLQAEIIDFVPDLPAAKVTAYNTLGMGNGMKIFLRFSSTFWDSSKLFYVITEGPAGGCWTPAKYQPGTTNDVFTCYSMGLDAEFMSALPDDAARFAQALSDLDLVFGGQATPNFVEGSIQDWSAEPYVRGTYSYPAPGSYPNGGSSMRQVLAQPVGGEVFFAGEATHNSAPSTVPGAIQTGERAAGEIDVALDGPPLPNAPSADFSPSTTSGPAPLDVVFTDTSSQTPTSWNWDFGDIGSSVDQNPTHQYTVPGTYTVSLTATNPDGSHTRVKPNLILVPEPGGGMQFVAGILGLAALYTRRPRRLGR